MISLNQLHGYQALEAPSTMHYRQHHANLCLEEISFTVFPSEKTGMEPKKANRKISISQRRLETPGILQKSSTPRKGSYHVTNMYKNGTIRIQKGILSERVNIRRISKFKQDPN
jgi:hypothetical protein